MADDVAHHRLARVQELPAQAGKHITVENFTVSVLFQNGGAGVETGLLGGHCRFLIGNVLE
jgi:hypothetical protein